ncbi:F-box domain [Arabidopsis suecica]|uniref:F-box domain n=1 Tax=Arabidopsis suecica TaxID=45249 RepID=A0A8T2FF38_ARASU|nr:F-box domain [Arabidopsis suecica]
MVDLVSSLPDDLLGHILSLLTTKEAALTSILSKRWRYLIAFVPYLEFDDSAFLNPEEGKQTREGTRQSFIDFVDRVLALHGDSPIRKFSLKCKTGVDLDLLNQWICNVLQRGVLLIDLSMDLGHRCMFIEIFMSRTLVELKLGSGCRIAFGPEHISALPMLKTLTLDSVSWSDSGQLERLLSACPALEALNLANVHGSYPNVTVSIASLKTLTIKSVSLSGPAHVFSFDTPNLLCLNYTALFEDDYPLVNLEYLVEAQIKFVLTDRLIKLVSVRNNGLLMLSEVQKLIRGISSVRKLYLSPGTLQVLGQCSQAMPVFNNLTFLVIESSMDIRWQAMPVLLKNCPRLETLVIKGGLVHCVAADCGDACTCISREEKGRSLASCPVKRLEIREFQGTLREMEMIKHFYYCFLCLKEMEIYVKDGRPQFLAPLASDSNPFKHLLGRNVIIKVHGSLT